MATIAKDKSTTNKPKKAPTKKPVKGNTKVSKGAKGIDKIYTETERYQMLLKAGYTSNEARTLRRKGVTEFLGALSKKSDSQYKKARNKFSKSDVQIRGVDIPKFAVKPAEYNYSNKYNYKLYVYYEDKLGNEITKYLVYSTMVKIPDNEINQELEEYCISAGLTYGLDFKGYEIIALEIKNKKGGKK